MSACGATVLTFPALIALVVLFFWTIVTGYGNNRNGNNGEYRPWYDFDLRPEEVEGIKVLVVLAALIVVCATLFGPIGKAGAGVYERFNVAVLAASMFMFGQMLFVTFWYFVNFGGRNQNNNGYYGGYGYNAYWAMDAEELNLYHEKVISYVALALALTFTVVSAGIHGTAQSLPPPPRPAGVAPVESHLVAETRFQALGETWTFLSLANIVVFASLFVAAILGLGGDDVERMVEEARLINLIVVLLCVGIVSVLMLVWGNAVFEEKEWGGLGVGLLYGATKYFAALLLLVCLCFASFSFDERQREEGLWVTTVTSFACFFLSLLHLAFALRTRRYQISVFDADSEQATKLDAQTEMVNGLGGGFVRVEETGGQVIA